MNGLPPFELVIFDCDGVLVDSELLSCKALIDCLRLQAIDIDLETALETFLGRSIAAVNEYCASCDRPLPDKFHYELKVAVRSAFAGGLQAIPQAASVLKGLTIPFCVASSSDLDRINYSLQLTGFAELAAGRMFSSEMVSRGKPAPDLFLYAAAHMRAAPARTLVIEDSVTGVKAGKAAGMTVWGFVGGSHYHSRDGRTMLLAAGADRVFDHMADFHGEPGGAFNRAVR